METHNIVSYIIRSQSLSEIIWTANSKTKNEANVRIRVKNLKPSPIQSYFPLLCLWGRTQSFLRISLKIGVSILHVHAENIMYKMFFSTYRDPHIL